MRGYSIINKLTGFLLICIFAISITPKSSFHDLMASHNDECFDNHQFKGDQITRQSFNCHFENLVVESPYLWQYHCLLDEITIYLSTDKPSLNVDVFSNHPFFSELRGPPAVI